MFRMEFDVTLFDKLLVPILIAFFYVLYMHQLACVVYVCMCSKCRIARSSTSRYAKLNKALVLHILTFINVPKCIPLESYTIL